MKAFYIDQFLRYQNEARAQKALCRKFNVHHNKCKKFIRDWQPDLEEIDHKLV